MSRRFDGRPSVLYENRYCDQNQFDIIIFDECKESKDSTNSINKVESAVDKCNVVLIQMLSSRHYENTAVISSDIFVLGASGKKVIKTSCVNISSKSTWKKLTYLPDVFVRVNFSVCSFMKSLYLIGGYVDDYMYSKRCYKYEINHNKWTKIADLNIDRCESACAVFEGKLVTTGGYRYSGRTKSAESYDHHENKWSNLPDMIGWRSDHSSFSMGKKLFVIGGYSNVDAEVFDSISRKFTLFNLKRPCRNQFLCNCETINICRKMFVFCSCSSNSQPKLHVYNVDEKRWLSEEMVKSVCFSKPNIHKVPKQ